MPMAGDRPQRRVDWLQYRPRHHAADGGRRIQASGRATGRGRAHGPDAFRILACKRMPIRTQPATTKQPISDVPDNVRHWGLPLRLARGCCDRGWLARGLRHLRAEPVGWVELFARPIVSLHLFPFAKIRAFIGYVACPIHSEPCPLFPEINKASAFNAGRTARRGLLGNETTP